MKQLFGVVFFLMIGGGLAYWYFTEGAGMEGELTIAMPKQYMPALREGPQTLDDVVEILGGADPVDVERSLELLIESGRVKKTDDGKYVAAGD